MVKPLKKKISKTKKPAVRQLIKRLDALFSLYIRNKYADFSGYVECFTCGIKKPVKEMQNGHYVSRAVKSLRFYEKNTHPQCPGCNVFKHGNMDSYALALQRKYGDNILKDLNKIKNTSKSFTVQELLDLIAYYKNLVV